MGKSEEQHGELSFANQVIQASLECNYSSLLHEMEEKNALLCNSQLIGFLCHEEMRNLSTLVHDYIHKISNFKQELAVKEQKLATQKTEIEKFEKKSKRLTKALEKKSRQNKDLKEQNQF